MDDLPERFSKAKHTKANSEGVKLERENSYTVPKRRFDKLETIDDVVAKLFGRLLTS
jgi:hypothetical protein